jgi:hypothetical protein
MNKLFYIQVNDFDETGMNAISLVDAPAVEHNFLCFDKDKKYNLEFRDEAKHIITGVVALADTPIYRYNPSIGDYWVVFTKDTIQKMIEKYSRSGLFNSVNLDHDDQRFTNSVFMIESYVVNRERNIVPVGFEDIPDGSWICSFKVEDEQLWSEIVNTDKFNGFSLQGVFDLTPEPKEMTIDELIDSILETK